MSHDMLLPGTKFGDYRIDRGIKRSGMADVYLATHGRLGRQAAVKVLRADVAHGEESIKRFEREAITVASLQHPHILPAWDYAVQGSTPYLVMPFIPGGTLAAHLEMAGPLSLSITLEYLRQMADALDYTHQQGFVHRDVKPENFLLDDQGHLYLIDLGIVKLPEGAPSLTRSGAVTGTPEYMAPEQAAGHADCRSDLYALGVTLYKMLTGQLPYTGKDYKDYLEVLRQHQQSPLPLRPLREVTPPLPIGIEKVLGKAFVNYRGEVGRNVV